MPVRVWRRIHQDIPNRTFSIELGAGPKTIRQMQSLTYITSSYSTEHHWRRVGCPVCSGYKGVHLLTNPLLSRLFLACVCLNLSPVWAEL